MFSLANLGKYTIAFSLIVITPTGFTWAGSNTANNENANVILNLPEGGLVADEKSGAGILKQVEDAGYPVYNLKITLKNNQFSESFVINLEDVGVSEHDLYSRLEKDISFAYTSKTTNALLEITYEGEALLGNGVTQDNWLKITGRLEGADMATFGDLPDDISITQANGEMVEFKTFITEEMTKRNNQEVTGYYDVRSETRITAIK